MPQLRTDERGVDPIAYLAEPSDDEDIDDPVVDYFGTQGMSIIHPLDYDSDEYMEWLLEQEAFGDYGDEDDGYGYVPLND